MRGQLASSFYSATVFGVLQGRNDYDMVEKNIGHSFSTCRNSLIELYRVIFALTVVSYHAQYLDARWSDGTAHFVPLLGGNTAVEFFFILSGFLMSKAAYRETDHMDMKKLCKAAWRRILKKLLLFIRCFS